MADRKQNTHFLQHPRDFPNALIEREPSQYAQDAPQPMSDLGETDVFGDLLAQGEGLSFVDTSRLVNTLIDLRRVETRMKLILKTDTDAVWDRYHNNYDFSGKEDWQSKKVPPKLFIAVERLTSVICRIREQSNDWFDVVAMNEESQIYYNFIKTLTKHFLLHDVTDFDRQYRKAIKVGLLSSFVPMLVCFEQDGQMLYEETPFSNPESGREEDVSPLKDNPFISTFAPDPGKGLNGGGEDDESYPLPGKKMPRLRLQLLNPDYLLLDHTDRSRFKIWEYRYTVGEARREARVRGWNMEAVDRAVSKPLTTEDTSDVLGGFHEVRDAAKADRITNYKNFQHVKITNFFGDLHDSTTGELLLENSYFIVMNDAEVVYGPVQNPSWDGEDPIVVAPLIEVPFQAYGKSPVTSNIDMFDLWVEFLNLMVDYFQAVLYGVKEIDRSLLTDPEDIEKGGIYPGKAIWTDKGGQPNLNAVNNVPFSDVPQGFWQFMQIFQREVSDNTLLTDTMAGAPRTRGRVTGLEFERRQAEASSMIEFLFQGLQDNLLAPLIRKSFHAILQYMPQKMWSNWIDTHKSEIAPKDPSLQEKWNGIFEDMKSWTPAERWRRLAGFFKFRVRVYSALAERQMEIEKATFMLQVTGQIPMAAQYLKWDKILRYIVRAFSWDPEEVLSAEALQIPKWMFDPKNAAANDNEQMGPPNVNPLSGFQPGGQNIGPQSISTSPPFAPGAGGPGMPP